MDASEALNKTQPPKKGKKKKPTYVDVLKGLFPWKGDPVSEIIRKSIFVVAIIIFAVSAYYVFDYFWSNYVGKQEYDDIRNIYNEAYVSTTDNSEATVTEYYTMLPGAESLLPLNPETIGYITIPDTLISYPVVQRKSETDGNNFYLNHDFYGNESDLGAIFLDYRNFFDDVNDEGLLETPNSQNLIIYGHHMKDSQMFGSLKSYKNDHGFYGEHPLIYLNSNYKQYTYKIFGFFITNTEEESGEVWDYYNHLNFTDEADFYEYVNDIKIRSLILNDVDIQYGDELLLLSTCDTEFDDARFIVAARLVRSGEDALEGTENYSWNDNPLMPDAYYRWHGGSFDSEAEFVPYG